MPPPGVVAARERLAFVAQVLVGYNVEVTLKSGDVYEGVFHSASVSDAQWKKDDLVITVRMAELKATKAGRAQRSKPADVMKIAVADLVSLKASDVGMTDLAVGPSRSNADGFTDGGISKNERFERTLVAWTPGAGEEGMGGSDAGGPANGGLLEDPAMKSGKGKGGWASSAQNATGAGGAWDQFAANKEMFGVDTSFDESVYTTAVQRGGSGGITEREAARIAREIQNLQSTNVHMQEERGQRVTVDYDEEDLYGAVVGTGAAAGGQHAGNTTSLTKGGGALPHKPAWGSSKVPEGVRALADKETPGRRSGSPPVPKPNPPAPKTGGLDATQVETRTSLSPSPSPPPAPAAGPDKDKPQGSTLSATARPFSLSAKASAFVPSFGKKPAQPPPTAQPPMMMQGQMGGFQSQQYPAGVPFMMNGYPPYGTPMPGFIGGPMVGYGAPPSRGAFPGPGPGGRGPVGGPGGRGLGGPGPTQQQQAAMQQAAAAAALAAAGYGMFQPPAPGGNP
jgi:hypothetical protein